MMKSILRVALGTLVLLGMVITFEALLAAPASADPCGYGPSGGYGVRSSPYGWRRSRGYRGQRGCDPCRAQLDCTHTTRFVSRGQSWSLLRRHLHRIRIEPNHVHPRSYWYPRYRCDYGGGWRGRTCIGHDYPTTECPLVMAALGDPADIDESLRDPTPAERLGRGMERFFRGTYEDAAADFAAAAKADEEDLRPLYGQLYCAMLGEKDWRAAVGHMRALMKRNALDATDLLDLEGSFSDPETFTRFREGLVAYTTYHFHEVSAQIVAGWSFAATGDKAEARTHLKAALRFSPKNAVARHLLSSLDGEAESIEEPTPEPDPETPPEDALPDRDPPENLARRAG